MVNLRLTRKSFFILLEPGENSYKFGNRLNSFRFGGVIFSKTQRKAQEKFTIAATHLLIVARLKATFLREQHLSVYAGVL